MKNSICRLAELNVFLWLSCTSGAFALILSAEK